MHVVSNLALHLRGTTETGYYLEVVATGVGLGTPLLREHYGPMDRHEMDALLGVLWWTLRPGVGYWGADQVHVLQPPLDFGGESA